MREQYMRTGEGFLLVFSVTDRGRLVPAKAWGWIRSCVKMSYRNPLLCIINVVLLIKAKIRSARLCPDCHFMEPRFPCLYSRKMAVQ